MTADEQWYVLQCPTCTTWLLRVPLHIVPSLRVKYTITHAPDAHHTITFNEPWHINGPGPIHVAPNLTIR